MQNPLRSHRTITDRAEPTQIIQNHHRSTRTRSGHAEPAKITQNQFRSRWTGSDHAEPTQIMQDPLNHAEPSQIKENPLRTCRTITEHTEPHRIPSHFSTSILPKYVFAICSTSPKINFTELNVPKDNFTAYLTLFATCPTVSLCKLSGVILHQKWIQPFLSEIWCWIFFYSTIFSKKAVFSEETAKTVLGAHLTIFQGKGASKAKN